MVANRIAASVQARSTTKLIGLDPATVDYAVRLIHQVCCFAGSFDLVEEFRDQDLCRAIDRHDTAALFDRLMYDFSFQGISDEIAANYMHKHGQSDLALSPEKSGQTANLPKAANLLAFSRLPLREDEPHLRRA